MLECEYCELNDIEDEYHFIIKCPCYHELRRKYIKKYFYNRPSMAKFIELLSSDRKPILFNLAQFLKAAFSKRIANQYTWFQMVTTKTTICRWSITLFVNR